MNVGHVLLSKVGQELAPLCGSVAVEGFHDYVVSRWVNQGIAVSSPWPRAV